MKLNQKGMTLVEIIISVGLIAMVMVFLFKILVDIRHESTISSTNTKDMVNRTEIISKIQDQIIDDELREITITGNANERTITLTTSTKKLEIKATEKQIHFGDQTWELQDSNATYDLCHIATELVEDGSKPNSHFYVRLLIPVTSNHDEAHSPYDIEISYIGKKYSGFDKSNYESSNRC